MKQPTVVLLFAGICFSGMAQNINMAESMPDGKCNALIERVVIDPSDMPVHFAAVLLFADSTLIQNTVTDETGKFQMTVPQNKYKLIITQWGDTVFSTGRFHCSIKFPPEN